MYYHCQPCELHGAVALVNADISSFIMSNRRNMFVDHRDDRQILLFSFGAGVQMSDAIVDYCN